MNTPDISLAYKLALIFDKERGEGLLDEDSVSEEIDAANSEYVSDVKEFNKILGELEDALKKKDLLRQEKELVRLKVYSMNLVTTFTNLEDELAELVKAYAFLNERE